MTTDIVVRFGTSIMCLLVGFLAGRMTSKSTPVNTTGVGGEGAVMVSKPSRSNQVFGVVLAVMAVFSVVSASESSSQMEHSAERQSQCNEEFRRVLNERAGYTQGFNNDVEALIKVVALNVATPQAERTEQMGADLEKAFVDFMDSAQENRAAKAANPYPDPRCDVS